MSRLGRRIIIVVLLFLCGLDGPQVLGSSGEGPDAADSAEPSPFAMGLISESTPPPPTAVFNIARGQSFSYAMEIDSALLGTAPGNRTQILSVGVGRYPWQQRITRVGQLLSEDSSAVVLVRQAKFRNPRGGLSAGTVPLFLRQMASASIDPKTGSIIEELPSDSGSSGKDVVPGESGGFSQTLWEFYGQWMLHVSDTFSYEKVISAPPIGEIRITLETVGRDSVDGRDCYLVRYRRRPGAVAGLEKMYWIDVTARVVARVQDEGITMKLVTPPRKSSASGP